MCVCVHACMQGGVCVYNCTMSYLLSGELCPTVPVRRTNYHALCVTLIHMRFMSCSVAIWFVYIWSVTHALL